MRQIKLFETGGYGELEYLEKKVNEWLREHAALAIVGYHMSQSEARRTVAIEYDIPAEQPFR